MKRIVLIVAAIFSVSFIFSQTKTEIKPAELSQVLSSYINKNFSGYIVDKAFKIDNKGVMSTQVMVSKGDEKLALTFDKEFKLTKKASINPNLKVSTVKEDKKSLSPVKAK